MSQQNVPASEELAAEKLDNTRVVKKLQPGCELILAIDRQIRELTLDYTLWAAVLGVFASNYLRLDNYTLPILALMNLKMVLDIGTCWGRPEKKRLWAVAILFLLFLLALATALIVRTAKRISSRSLFTILGLFIPFIIVLNGAIGHGLLTWVMGKLANQFYLNSLKADSATLQRLIQVHQIHNHERETR